MGFRRDIVGFDDTVFVTNEMIPLNRFFPPYAGCLGFRSVISQEQKLAQKGSGLVAQECPQRCGVDPTQRGHDLETRVQMRVWRSKQVSGEIRHHRTADTQTRPNGPAARPYSM